ncbi:MAG: nucleotidyltransferase family protein [Desulfobacteraceae bacterium]|nr:nucleotidyltransferase family protein [Desulfobacteraceae bacterium]
MQEVTPFSIGAVILAAGLSSRMSKFKPLLKFGDKTALEKVIDAFVAAGAAPVLVVTGHRHEQLNSRIERTTARAVFNPDFRQGMYSSVRKGVEELPRNLNSFFVHPVDMPLISKHVLLKLKSASKNHPGRIVYPCYRKIKGRPVLIPSCLRQKIFDFKEPGGLRHLLSTYCQLNLDIEVNAPGILWDMDYDKDYKQLVQLHN